MTISEKAHELGEMIKASPEMENLQRLEKAQAEDENAKNLLKEFNLQRMNLMRDLQEEKISREDASKKNMEAFDAMLKKSQLLADYVEAKKAFDELVQEVNGIINHYITGEDEHCTHNCSTCGGCH